MVIEADGGPFFLFLNFLEPHRPWVSSGRVPYPVPGYEQTFDEFACNPSSPRWIVGKRPRDGIRSGEDGGGVRRNVAYMDDVVGRLLERLAGEPWYDAEPDHRHGRSW